MSLDDNKAIIRAFVETVWNRRQLDRADEVVAADFVDHAPLPGRRRGWKASSESGQCISTRFRTFASRSRSRSYEGTHRGELLGIPATGKRLQFGGISIFRLAEGRIAEHWEQLDRLALMQQLGVVPAPGARSGETGPATSDE